MHSAHLLPRLLLLLNLSLLVPLAAQPAPPELLAATLLGGSAEEDVEALGIAPDGTVYVVGTTQSADFPVTPDAFDTTLGGERDAYVARLSADLSTLLAATYLGGEIGSAGSPAATYDYGHALVIGADGVYVAGLTYTSDFPTTAGTISEVPVSAPDGFVTKLSFDLSTVLVSTYLGGDRLDQVLEGTWDESSDELVVAGFTNSATFPFTDGAYSTEAGLFGGPFVARLNADLTEVTAATGLDAFGQPHALAVAPATGALFLAGETTDAGFPTTAGALDSTCGTDGVCNPEPLVGPATDGFVVQLSADLSTLVASTYLGGEGPDDVRAFALDGTGGLYVAGGTTSSAFPVTPGAHQTTLPALTGGGFLVQLDTGLTTASRGTYLGGDAMLSRSPIFALRLDLATDRAFVAGWTTASDFPVTPDAFDDSFEGLIEPYVAVLPLDLATVHFASFLGGNDVDAMSGQPAATELTFAPSGDIYVAGEAVEEDFPTTGGAYQEALAGARDGFVAQIGGFAVPTEPSAGTRPATTELLASYPNPFASVSTFRFRLAAAGAVRLSVYDVRGREVAVLVDGSLAAGTHEAHLDARRLASGTYFVRFTAGDVTQTQPVSLVR